MADIKHIKINGQKYDIRDDSKQPIITDLAAIRSGALLGSTALQAVPNTYRTSADQDVIDTTIRNIAEGKTKAYAVDSDVSGNSGFKSDTAEITVTSFTDLDNNTITVSDLNKGDLVYVKNTTTDKYYDRWLINPATGTWGLIDADSPALNNYYTKYEADNLLGNKLDKLTTAGNHLYAHNGSTQFEYTVGGYSDSITYIGLDGGMEVGHMLDLHLPGSVNDHDVRLKLDENVSISAPYLLTLPTSEGSLCTAEQLTRGDIVVAKASKDEFGNTISATYAVVDTITYAGVCSTTTPGLINSSQTALISDLFEEATNKTLLNVYMTIDNIPMSCVFYKNLADNNYYLAYFDYNTLTYKTDLLTNDHYCCIIVKKLTTPPQPQANN